MAKNYWLEILFVVLIIVIFSIYLTFGTWNYNLRLFPAPKMAATREVLYGKPPITEIAEQHCDKCSFPSFRNTTELPAGTNILVTKMRGRLGNQMYILASTYALAKDNSMTPMVLNYNDLMTCFPELNIAKSPRNNPEKKWPVLNDGGKGRTYKKELHDMFGNNTSIFLMGFLQSWRYFHHRESELRCQFIFNKAIQKNVDIFLHAAAQIWSNLTANKNKDNSTGDGISQSVVPHFIGIHVRRGDFVGASATKHGDISPGSPYFTRAMQHMADLFENVVFVVASDDMVWSKANIKSDRYIVIYSTFTKANQDMCLLDSCNHTIMSAGTYSWWGAWLAGGHTVYPKGYPIPGSTLMTQTIKEDYYLPGWVELNTD